MPDGTQGKCKKGAVAWRCAVIDDISEPLIRAQIPTADGLTHIGGQLESGNRQEMEEGNRFHTYIRL